ncbi:hypothetical protein CDAR_567291 [Caerostris darwini]|uniref:Uncharacterized protein n=1 Tax=Caerostris darwini TaxID=1538125 RepID=A0AAV4QZR6_9ARAC|nr:hypothetical protein CDAR_567291 [Caerostris darwini]
MDELLHNILPCTPPPATQSRVTCHSSSPSTIIQIEDSESVLPHPRPSCDSPSTIVVIEDDKHCTEPLGLCHDTVVNEVDLYPSDLEVRDLFYDGAYSPREGWKTIFLPSMTSVWTLPTTLPLILVNLLFVMSYPHRSCFLWVPQLDHQSVPRF